MFATGDRRGGAPACAEGTRAESLRPRSPEGSLRSGRLPAPAWAQSGLPLMTRQLFCLVFSIWRVSTARSVPLVPVWIRYRVPPSFPLSEGGVGCCLASTLSSALVSTRRSGAGDSLGAGWGLQAVYR